MIRLFADVIQPIALPDGQQNNNFNGWTALASGFGATADGTYSFVFGIDD